MVETPQWNTSVGISLTSQFGQVHIIRGYTGVYRGIQGYTGVYSGIQTDNTQTMIIFGGEL